MQLILYTQPAYLKQHNKIESSHAKRLNYFITEIKTTTEDYVAMITLRQNIIEIINRI